MGAEWQASRQIACFSFHPRKFITTGEGGMLTTFNSEFDDNSDYAASTA
jgi:dTDP-4-amino-4,6-dideoxygalactose transaminase